MRGAATRRVSSPSRSTRRSPSRRASASSLLELACARRLEPRDVAREPRPQLGQVLGDALDEIRVEQELPLDLLDRVAVGHQLLDVVDPADRLGRVHAERAAVLALAADAPAARQQALLDVLAEARLGELDPAAREASTICTAVMPSAYVALDRAQLLLLQQERPRATRRHSRAGASSSRRCATSASTGRRCARNGTTVPVGASAWTSLDGVKTTDSPSVPCTTTHAWARTAKPCSLEQRVVFGVRSPCERRLSSWTLEQPLSDEVSSRYSSECNRSTRPARKINFLTGSLFRSDDAADATRADRREPASVAVDASGSLGGFALALSRRSSRSRSRSSSGFARRARATRCSRRARDRLRIVVPRGWRATDQPSYPGLCCG